MSCTDAKRRKRRIAPGLLLVAVGPLLAPGPANAQSNPGDFGVIAAPPGNTLFLKAHATGTQDYICLPGTSDPRQGSWVFQRPEAVLSVPAIVPLRLDVAEHRLDAVPQRARAASPSCVEAASGGEQYCPSWRNPLDQSEVWGEKLAGVTAGTSPICPSAGAIACLLLKTVAISRGQFNDGLFTRTTYVQRTNTSGGSPPAGACMPYQTEQVPYTADYSFYAATR
jgi:hypothetical protein